MVSSVLAAGGMLATGLVPTASASARGTATTGSRNPAGGGDVLLTSTTPATGAPNDVHALANNASATVTWDAPTEVKGSPVTGFTVTASTGQEVTVGQPNDWAIIDGLANGQRVSFTVTATSAAGTSAKVRSNAVQPDPIAEPTDVLKGKRQSVSFDNYSLKIGGKRVFIWSGEFDPWRTPSPSLWLDRLEKMKAAGFNAVTPYFDWDYTSPSPGVYNFSGVRDMNLFLNDAQKVGLYVIARPGPYINAETDGGGFPGWLVTQSGTARTDAADYMAAAMQWMSEIDPIIAAHQITRGGDVIAYQVENELFDNSSTTDAYMEALETKAREDGIDVPLTGNSSGTFVGTPAEEQIPGYDTYPMGFNCSDPTSFTNPPDLASGKLSGIPLLTPEYQGGSYDSWGGSGYQNCQELTGSSFENVFYKQNLAAGVTMESNYMTVGGTNWGWLPAPFMYTSYDYGAAISENGVLPAKYTEDKLIGEMTQAISPLTMTASAAAGSPTNSALSEQETANPSTGTHFVYVRQSNASSTSVEKTKLSINLSPPDAGYTYDDTNPELSYSGSWSHVSDQSYTSGDYDQDESFSDTAGDSMTVSFTGSSVQWVAPFANNHGIAQVYLDGNLVDTVDTYAANTEFQQVAYQATGLADTTHTLKIVVTGTKDANSGGTFVSIDAINVPKSGQLLTVPAEGNLVLRGREAAFLVANYRFDGQDLVYSTSQLATQRMIGNQATALLYGDQGTTGETVLHYSSQPKVTQLSGGQVQTTWDQASGQLRLDYTHGALAQVRITQGGHSLLLLIGSTRIAGQFWADSTGESSAGVLVQGGYLLRSAALSGHTLKLSGDTTTTSRINVWAPSTVTAVTWNGKAVRVQRGASGTLGFSVGGPAKVTLPQLVNWKFAFESPERLPSYNDSSWTVANHMSTTNPTQPVTYPVLYADDYGFHHGFVWYRGHFTATGNETGITLTADGGQYGAYQVWLNGAMIGSNTSNSSGNPVTQTFAFPAADLRAGKDNVVAVLVQSTGHNEDGVYGGSPSDSQKQPRGLMGAVLNTSSGTTPTVTWRLQGDEVGANNVDPARGPLNDAGLYGTNHGWDLPGYPDSSWASVKLPDSWASRGVPAGIGWYRTTFKLNIPAGTDDSIGLKLPLDGSQTQNLIYLNGWLVGREIDYLGPQDTFYLPEGLLNEHGTNTLAIASWSLADGQGGIGQPQLVSYQTVAGGIPVATVKAQGWSQKTYGPPGLPSNPTSSVSAPSMVNGGSTVKVSVQINPGGATLSNAVTTLSAPSGWTVTPASTPPVTISANKPVTEMFSVQVPAGANPGPAQLSANTTFTGPAAADSPLSAAASVQVPYPNLADSYDNVAVTSNSDTNPSSSFLGFDGIGTTFSQEGLAAAGLSAGASVTSGGVTFQWPSAAAATDDNTLASGQVVSLNGQGSTLGFLLDGNNATVGGTGTVYYSDGTSSTFSLSVGNFWWPSGEDGNPANTQVATVDYANYPSGPTTHPIYVFEQSVPINPAKQVAAVQLPQGASSVVNSAAALHVFAMGIGSD